VDERPRGRLEDDVDETTGGSTRRRGRRRVVRMPVGRRDGDDDVAGTQDRGDRRAEPVEVLAAALIRYTQTHDGARLDTQTTQRLVSFGVSPFPQLVRRDERRPWMGRLAVGDRDDHDLSALAMVSAHQTTGLEHLVVGVWRDHNEPSHGVHHSVSGCMGTPAASMP
jgi:hypothetical protein